MDLVRESIRPAERNVIIHLRSVEDGVVVDEDVPGGCTAYMMQKALEEQDTFHWLDAPPVSVTGTEHRPAYGSDGDYFSKPNRESIFNAVYSLVRESDPSRFPPIAD